MFVQDLGLRDVAQFEGWVQPPELQREEAPPPEDEFKGKSEQDITRELAAREDAEDDHNLHSLVPLEEVILGQVLCTCTCKFPTLMCRPLTMIPLTHGCRVSALVHAYLEAMGGDC